MTIFENPCRAAFAGLGTWVVLTGFYPVCRGAEPNPEPANKSIFDVPAEDGKSAQPGTRPTTLPVGRGDEGLDVVLPIPPAAALEKAAAAVKTQFAKSLADSSPQVRLVAAADMARRAGDNTDTPAVVFKLLAVSRDTAAAAGDAALAVSSADTLAGRFQIAAADALKAKLRAIQTAVDADASLAGNAGHDATVRAARVAAAALLATGDEAIETGEWSVAAEAAEQARKVGAIADDETFAAAADALAQRAKDPDESSREYRAAKAALLRDPADAHSNLVAGTYLCFVSHDWPDGLPLLARSGDAQLVELARQEAVNPKEPADQETLASSWWQYAETRRAGPRERARYWYAQALPGLGGLVKVRADMRVRSVAAAGAMPAAKHGLRVTILKASYGAGEQQADVTAAVQHAIDADPFIAIAADNSMAGDSAPGYPKKLTIRRGKTAAAECNENYAVVVPPFPPAGFPLPSDTPRTFKIVAARYGTGYVYRDVTEAARKLVEDPGQTYSFTHDMAGGDPREGFVKHLLIWFNYEGRRYVNLSNEIGGPCTFRLVPPVTADEPNPK